ncbi:hypothetical protein SK128_027622 [Halocaridina rubra]|uniref:Uncharacterized protein n=1 Tax=Halocaridina rubra TaxID=373956 RepID=A0AAN9A4I0_HALRR
MSLLPFLKIAVPASKQLKLSVLDGDRSFDLVNAKPARYHCTSLEVDGKNQSLHRDETAWKVLRGLAGRV